MTDYAFVVAIQVVDLCGHASPETFVSFFDVGNVDLVPFEDPLPKCLMSCSRLCRLACSLSQHLPENVFFWQSAPFGIIAQEVRCDV